MDSVRDSAPLRDQQQSASMDDPTANLGNPGVPWDFDKMVAAARPLEEDEPIDRIWLDTRAMASTVIWFAMCQFTDAVHPIQFPLKRQDDGAYQRCLHMWSEIRALGWPLKYRNRLLGIVIRQWVEDDADEILAVRLAQSEEIKSFIKYARESGQYTDEAGIDAIEYSLSLKLKDFGLPCNPSVTRHVLALVDGRHPPLPARGILVTTLGYLTKPFEDINIKPALWRFGPPHDVLVEGVNEWITGDLLGRAHRLVRQHREFLEAFGPYPLADPKIARQFGYDQSLGTWGGRKPADLDYEEEAVRSIGKINWEHINGVQGALSEHLRKVYHRVYNARIRAGLATKPPDGWPDRARKRILSALSAKPECHAR